MNYICLLPMLMIASVFDIRTRRIPNRLTYSMVLIGLLLAAIGTFARSIFGDSWLQWPTSSTEAWGGAFASFSILFLIYSYTNSGAGDVKLAAGIGSLLGMQGGVLTICYAYIAAATFAVCLLLWKFGFGFVLRGLLRHLRWWPWPEDSIVEQKAKELMSRGLPLAPFFLIGTCIHLLF